MLLSFVWGYFLVLFLQVCVCFLLHLHPSVWSVDDVHTGGLVLLFVACRWFKDSQYSCLLVVSHLQNNKLNNDL